MSEILLSEPERMLDVIYYRDAVLEIILGGKHIPREVYELRLALFLRAANSYFQQSNNGHIYRSLISEPRELLEPFPHCFYDKATKGRSYDELRLCISSIPNLSEINEESSLPELLWELLLWIFTNPLDIQEQKKSPTSEVLTRDLRERTKLKTIPYPSNTCRRFEITHPIEINSTKLFIQHRSKLGSFYAYHGSPSYNFHSIIHRGLRGSLNVTSAYGKGTYLSSDLRTAESYSKKFHSSTYSHNKRNPGDVSYCIAIVEVIKHPSIKVVNLTGSQNAGDSQGKPNFDDTSSDQTRYYIVNSDELMRLKHLLVFY